MTTRNGMLRGTTAVDVHFYSDGTPVAGTLDEVPEPVAAAVLITGSGRLDRDSGARPGRRGPVVLALITAWTAKYRGGRAQRP